MSELRDELILKFRNHYWGDATPEEAAEATIEMFREAMLTEEFITRMSWETFRQEYPWIKENELPVVFHTKLMEHKIIGLSNALDTITE